jgi:nucleoid DNA-binding protein
MTVINSVQSVIEAHLSKKGPGVFTLPGIVKFRVIKKPATKARKGVNPFTGEPMTFKAKPARNVIKVRLLKNLKDTVK